MLIASASTPACCDRIVRTIWFMACSDDAQQVRHAKQRSSDLNERACGLPIERGMLAGRILEKVGKLAGDLPLFGHVSR